MDQITKEWETALITAPKIVSACTENQCLWKCNLRHTPIKGVPIELRLFSVDEQTAESIITPEHANILTDKYFVVFSLLSQDRNVDSLIY